MQRVALLNGSTINQDYDGSALGVALIDGGVYEGLVLSNVSGNNRKVTLGKALIKVTKTAGAKVLVHYENTADVTFTQAGPFKVWIEIDQTNIDNPLLNVADGSGAGAIAYGASYPAGNYISLGEVNGSNAITVGATAIVSIPDLIQEVINNITTGGTTFGDITVNSILLPGGDVQSQIDTINTSGIPSQSIVEIEKYIMGEGGSPGENIMTEQGPTFAQATSRQKVGDVTANTRSSIPYFGNGLPFNTLKLSLDKTLSPSADISIRIEEDDGAGKSSGVIYDPIATATILAGAVTNSPVDTTFTFAGSTVANGHGVTLATTSATTDYKGVSFTLTSQESFISCTKSASCTATKAYLYDSTYTLLQTVTFSGNIAVFNNTSLILGQTYHILAGSDGSSYTQAKQSGASAYPYTATKLDYINGIVNGPAVTDTLTVSGYFGGVGPSNPTFTFSVNAPCFITSVPSLTGYYGTSNAQLSLSGNILETGTLGVFTGNTMLLPGNTYQVSYSTAVVCDQYATASFPQVKSSVTYISSSGGRRDMTSYKFPAEVTTKPVTIDTNIYNITSISSAGNLYVPDGQLVHIVAYVGAYGAETINPTNYYTIGYSTNHTTTRPMRTYNGSVWSSALSSQFAYVSSAGCHDIVFTKTDADYTYKLPVDGPRLLTQATAMGQKPMVTRRFLNSVLSGMTRLTKMFLSSTPGAISALPGTNRYAVGVAKSATELDVFTESYGYGDGLTILSSDSEITNTNTTLTKVKEIYSNSQFTWNVYFEIKTNTTTGGKQGEGRIYVNGVAVGTLRTINTSSYSSYSEYITVNAGDLIQIYARVNDNSAGYTVYIRNFRLRASVVTTRDNIGYTIT